MPLYAPIPEPQMQPIGFPTDYFANLPIPNPAGLGGLAQRANIGTGNFMRKLGGALFPVSPILAQSMTPDEIEQMRYGGLLNLGLGALAAKERGAGFGAGMFDAFNHAQATTQGAMDNAFRNSLVKRQEDREQKRAELDEKAADREMRRDTATTAGRLSRGIGSAKDPGGYWNLVQNMPEVQETLRAYGIDPSAVTPEMLPQIAQQLAAAGEVGGLGAKPEPLQLKAVMDPTTGKQVLVPEEQAIGLEPGYAPPMAVPTYQLSSMDQPGGMKQNVVFNPRTGQIEPTGQPFKPPEQVKPTAENQTAAGYLSRMSHAEQILGSGTPSYKDFMLAGAVLAGNAVMAAGANKMMSAEGKKYYQAAADWVRAKLRKESGAVISEKEMLAEIRTYFPLPNDPPEVVAQKAQARRIAMQAMQQSAGPAAPASAGGATGSWDEGWKIEKVK